MDKGKVMKRIILCSIALGLNLMVLAWFVCDCVVLIHSDDKKYGVVGILFGLVEMMLFAGILRWVFWVVDNRI